MSYKFVSDISKKEYNDFLKDKSMVSFMQNYDWDKVKDNWGSYHCGLYKNKKLVGVCLILVKNLFKGIKLFYVPRGYVIDFLNYEDLEAMTLNIKKFAKKEGAYVVKVDPNFCISDNSFKDEEVEHNYSLDSDIKHNNLVKLGYKRNKLSLEMGKDFQPRFNIFAPLCDTNSKILSSDIVKSKYKRIKSYIGSYQEKRGVSFYVTDDIDKVDDLVFLLQETERKQNIKLRNKDYFVRIMKSYKNLAYMIFAKIDLNIYIKFLEESKASSELIDEAISLKEEFGDTMLLSGSLVILPKNKTGIRTSEYLYAGNNLNLTKLHVSTALVFEVIKFSIEKGCHYCNLGGVHGTLDDYLTKFKRNFSGRIMEFTGEYDLPVSILYYPIKIFYPLAVKLYKLFVR